MKLFDLAENLRRLLPGLDYRLDLLAVGQGRLHAQMIRTSNATLEESEFSVFSQWGEDGIIQRLIQLVPIANRTFIEFGVEDFRESNCRFLMIKDDWRGMVIDGDPRNIGRIRKNHYFWRHDLQATAAFIDADNIDALLCQSGFDSDLGLLSIDIDGNDYWVLERIRSFRPRILVVEYSAIFGADRAISVPYDPAFVRRRAHYSELYFGASLPAFAYWAERNGYDLVGSNGTNAFFVRADIRPDALPAKDTAEAFTDASYRVSRDPRGNLTYLPRQEQLAAIRGLPVVNVMTGEPEQI